MGQGRPRSSGRGETHLTQPEIAMVSSDALPSLENIPLADIDLEDHPFAPALAADLSRLKESLVAVGLLAPPWLRRKDRGRWQVVAGAKRLRAAAELGWEALPAFTLPTATPDSRCLLIALDDNALSRSFNPLEQVHLASLLLEHWDRSTVIRKFLPVLGLPPAPAFLTRLLAVAALEAPFHTLVAQERLALTAAVPLAGWAPEDRRAALPFLESLPFSQSKQEEFLENLEILARREGLRPAAILSRPELQRRLADPASTPQAKAEAVRRQLRLWVLPRLSAAQAAWQAGLKELGLDRQPRLSLKPPPAFEGPDFELNIRFRDAPELAQLLTELLNLAGREEFHRLTT